MGDPWDDAELANRFRTTADASGRRAPLNAALARVAARDHSLSSLLAHAPESQRLPVLLLNSVHHELLADRSHELAQWYPNLTESPRSPDDPGLTEVFTRFVHDHAPAIIDSIGHRRIQTNEVGRTALLVAGLGDPSSFLDGRPIAHLDVGTSAGLNLLLDRLRYRFVFDDGRERAVAPSTGVSDPIEITTRVRGDLPLAERLPDVVARRGIDQRPVDLADEVARRWLEACVWPDQADRFARLHDAIGLARRDPPRIVVGDAVDALAEQVGELRTVGVPLVTTTWVLNYLTTRDQQRFVETLDDLGSNTDLVWVAAEAPALTPALPHADGLGDDERTAVIRVVWQGGVRLVEHVGIGHPHGYWIHAGV